MTNDTWGQAREELRKTVGKNAFTSWIEPLELTSLDGGVASFDVPTNFMRDWVSRNFAEQIREHLTKAGAIVDRVDFIVPKPRAVPARKAAGAAPNKAPTAQPVRSDEGEILGAPLDARFTFDSFVVGKPNELAHAAARRVAEGGPVTFNPLFLYGGVGLGKTHLMHAIAHEMQIRQPQLRVLYLSAEQFMYRFIQALRDKQIMDFKELFRSVDVLMVDDVQFIAGKDSTQEEFFHAFNALHQAEKQIVVTSDKYPQQLERMEERLISRFTWGLVADVQAPELETRVAIVRKKPTPIALLLMDQAVISGIGMFNDIALPDVPGLNDFKGTLFHTARWPKEPIDLAGKRVGVIGNGATGIQVIQTIADKVDLLKVFVRTPQYVLPMKNPAYDAQAVAAYKDRFDELKSTIP